MDLQINYNKPTIMHCDLNSCYASIEQQCNRFLCGKPVVVVAYKGRNPGIISPSIEAKAMGIKMPIDVLNARLICKDIIVVEADARKYEDVHIKFANIFKDYSPVVIPKSIDEVTIDFSMTTHLRRDLVDLAKEIKQRIRDEIGEWMKCSIGISTNHFLAKQAAGLHKPDGLDVIDHNNLIDVYQKLELMDLNGINIGYTTRLNQFGIFTPIEFLEASKSLLKEQVFQSIVGQYWYFMLRGYEAYKPKKTTQFGKEYALRRPSADTRELSKILIKLCEMAGRKMRKAGYKARGVAIYCGYRDRTSWHMSMSRKASEVYTLPEIYRRALYIFNMQPERKVIGKLAMCCFDIMPVATSQMSLFDRNQDRDRKLADSVDELNNRYGEQVVIPALMMDIKEQVQHRIPFGGTRGLEDLYN